MRLLCLSDIHGDARALGAVLALAERTGYARLLVAGDLCFPGPAPMEVWRRLVQAGATCVQGVSDRAIATLDPAALPARNDQDRERVEALSRARSELGELILARLLRLETKVRVELPDGSELLLVHGSPADPTEPITHDMSDEEIRGLLSDDPADIIVCGGSHTPFDRTVMGVRIVNVGSVGQAISTGGPRHADATFIEIGPAASRGAAAFEVTQIAVPLESSSSSLPAEP
jgi:predicted phosphodiesterase